MVKHLTYVHMVAVTEATQMQSLQSTRKDTPAYSSYKGTALHET